MCRLAQVMSAAAPDDVPTDHRQQARHGALLFAAAAVVTVAGLLLPHQPEVNELGLVVVAVGAALAGLVMRLADDRLPGWAYQLVFAWGTLLVSLALLFNGEREGGAAGGDELYYLWVVLYSAYYFGRRAVMMQVLLVVVAYAGTLALIDPGPIGPSRWITMTGLVVGTAVVVRLLSERIERLIGALDAAARTDRLTGLPNRRAFEEHFAREAARACRAGRPLALLLADVDRFKDINDRWGHAAGDSALVAVADVFRETLRTCDTPARIGGDEFVVLLPETDDDGAQVVATRLAEAVTARGTDAALRLTLSFGVAAQHPDGGSLDDLMRTADMALYAAKRERPVPDCGSPGSDVATDTPAGLAGVPAVPVAAPVPSRRA